MIAPVTASFYWTRAPWGAALRCRALDDLAPHLFSTRQLELSEDGEAQLREALDARQLAMITQVHGAIAVVVRGADGLPSRSTAGDVLVSDATEVAVAVRTADCVPVLIADRRTGAVAAVHAGWRGTAGRATPAAVAALQHEFGSRPGDLVAAIGPAIGACCYEVGPDVVDAFAAAGHHRSLVDRWFLPQPRRRGAAGPALHLDVPGANRDQLVLAGVPEEQVHVSGLCTAMHLDVLTSYRVERETAGRLVAAIRARRPV